MHNLNEIQNTIFPLSTPSGYMLIPLFYFSSVFLYYIQ